MYQTPRIPVGSWVLVTGVNGLVASNIADLLLKSGYKVRGSVRDPAKTTWMKEHFDSRYGKGNFEIAAVDNLTKEGAFDKAMQGMSGVAHVASIIDSFDPTEAIPGMVAGAVNILKSAAKEPSVKAFVYTSSSWAAAKLQPNIEYSIGPDSWNTHAIEAAWAPPPYTQERMMDVYAAGKAQAEQASWKFMDDNKPEFVFNAVIPSCNFGAVLSPEHQGYRSTAAWLRDLFIGKIGMHLSVPPQYAIDNIDCARLHVGALLDSMVEGQRIFGYAEPYTWNELLAIFRRKYPDLVFMDDIPDQGQDLSRVANEGAIEILKRMGRTGFVPLEDTIDAAVQQILSSQA